MVTQDAYIVTLGFANPSVLEDTLRQVRKTRTTDFPHYILNQHYPLPSEAIFTKRLYELAGDYGCIILDAGVNLGLHHGLNYAASQVPDLPFMIGLDPDTCPITSGWDEALVNVLRENRDIAWTSLINPSSQYDIDNKPHEFIQRNGYNLIHIHQAVINSICAFRMDWVNSVDGFIEPSEFYGGLECSMAARLGTYKWVFLRDFKEERDPVAQQNSPDQIYGEYKWDHAFKGYPHDFARYIEDRQNGMQRPE